MKPRLFLDNETRSRVDLKKSNAYRYTQDPDFQVLMCAWSTDKVNIHVAIGHDEISRIPGLFDAEVVKVAWNASWERITFSAMAGLPEGTYFRPEEYDDPMIRAAENGYPMKLENAAKSLGTTEKDSAGTRLISLFSKPNRKGEFNNADTHPEEWQEFIRYCVNDVLTLIELDDAIPDWPPGERERWIVDQYINDNGIPVDVPMARAAVETGAANGRKALEELQRLSGIVNPNSPVQMKDWLAANGVPVKDLRAETVTNLLSGDDLPATVRRVLELRQETALISSRKFEAALDRVSGDGRLRGSFQFFGAHTGRFSGRGVQLQNLPSASLGEKSDSFERVEDIIAGTVLDLKLGNGATAHELKALVRPMFVGPFTVVDYSAIEARVIAWLAGEEWALQAFRDGRDIYVETAKRLGEGFTRKEGKVASLALGFGSGVDGLAAFGAEGGKDHLMRIRDLWRASNPSIVRFWKSLEDAFWHGDRPAGPHIFVEKHGNDRHVRLPSGRAIVYHDIRYEQIIIKDEPRMAITFADPKGWRTATYGGRASENSTQAVARDVLAEALVRLHNKGFEVVGSVHDEAIILGSSVDEVLPVMIEPPSWAEGLPIAAAGYQCNRYRKD